LATIQEVNSAIMFGNFSDDQLNGIISAIKYRRAQITKDTKRALRIGSTVKFTSSKTGGTVVGTVEKIAVKYVTVRESNSGRLVTGLWKVPANMLEVA